MNAKSSEVNAGRGACVACHELDGSGSPRIYPPLPGNANLQSANPASTLRIILDGAQTLTTPRAPNAGSMPAYPKLTDQEVADVATYIRNSWGNAAPAVTVDEHVRRFEVAMDQAALVLPAAMVSGLAVMV